ncbi:hypothetical protein [Phaeobacter sp. 22II1-1F12B]|uniref:hypothetical protein n=1 Tax=Phaeobacter sp. 22II1-1F12B TaxID=1317111 RepID=UPI000B523D1D|nr:hypothetical protein [Phaeobacter sp. 22II1-1F12B]OWU68767.1 hypothetical protein ATO1_25020 [Phaeobacter sp. 22II1-1F12B]
MSSLTDIEKRYMEKLLDMGGGYVLDYSDASYGEFFKRHGINIHGPKYQTYGTSKAKKMRAFWEQESDQVVGKVLSEMMDSYEADGELNGRDVDQPVLEKARGITNRLLGKRGKPPEALNEESFLDREFSIPNVGKLPIDAPVVPIVEARLKEARVAIKAGASLSVIFLCGSVLEAVLLGAAQQSPARFNTAKASPRNDSGDVRRFHEWSLAQFIDVASELGMLKPDVKKFGHGLRDFRNFIHPYQQLASGFAPDQHTAKVCFQVLKAALADVAGER